MRMTAQSIGLTVISTLLALQLAVASPADVVYLDGPADLARLRVTNPEHYARAEKILAAANQLCRPKQGDVSYARFQAGEISCSDMLLKTSNPPKRQIHFTLDDTHYIALVVITDDPPRLLPAR
jgi:hypothetical protein